MSVDWQRRIDLLKWVPKFGWVKAVFKNNHLSNYGYFKMLANCKSYYKILTHPNYLKVK
ncbi:hypothetical protein LP123_03350 [Moraxella bovis]|uniref:Uncharacterized protein n=1 Tax=Moraxella bovis TaxID=476 RepID=A0AAQ2Q4N0_MORBO|nr:hypothetical protein [Moraxella bovis]UYZ75249.1 hypothetical protein LP093_10895 [Moraxella bovis]UYZ78819.1 hypothetical protein LP115_02955 [Moraxella bovis]UYZ80598.1 hypothetical protein LP113_11270 [Moraxella bovis]UYZ87302.1 hypothetical protein LP094_02970 [Moraxella bovis]UYZ90039.1 hypothetical protein LP114_02845 [Moraxella bovis]